MKKKQININKKSMRTEYKERRKRMQKRSEQATSSQNIVLCDWRIIMKIEYFHKINQKQK